MRRFSTFFSLIAAASFTLVLPFSSAQATEYTIDPAHSEVGFKILHLGISNVRGYFGDFSGTFSYDKDAVEKSSVEAVVDIASISTNNQKRDKHLRSCDFFCTDKYTQMKFVTKEVKKGSGKDFQIIGTLDLHGVKKDVVLDAKLLGEAEDDFGNKRIAFTAEGKLNRKEYGLKWNELTEAGGFLVGEDVSITLEITGKEVKKAS